MSDGGIDQDLARKERELLEMDYTSPCSECGAVVFDWRDSETCRDCDDSDGGTTSEQATLIPDGGVDQEGDEVDHDVQTECGCCSSQSFHIYEAESGEIEAIECAICGEVFDL